MGLVRSAVMMPVRLVTGLAALSVSAPAAVSAMTRLPADLAALLGSATDLVIRIEQLVLDVDRSVAEVRGIAVQASAVAGQAQQTAAEAATAIGQAQELLRVFEPALQDLAPLLSEFTDRASTRNVAAVVEALDVLPELTELVVPAVRNLVELIPELDMVIERMDNMGRMVEGLPGARRLMRRAQADS